MEANKIYQVGVILFDGVDMLDFAGPVGVLSDVKYVSDGASGQSAFRIHHIAAEATDICVGAAKTRVKPDLVLKEAYEKLDELDILVLPGGPPGLILGMATSNGPEVRFIREFTTRAGNGRKRERMALSICDGSLFLAAVGALSGLRATSHHSMLHHLTELDGSIDVVDSTVDRRARRYVDGGVNEAGVRIVTAGGVTCGLDASLYVAEVLVGRASAEAWAEMNEYEWKRAKVDG